MFSEIAAEATARTLEKIILKAIKDPRLGDFSDSIRNFVNEELVEWYYLECSNTWGSYHPNPEILKAFPPKE